MASSKCRALAATAARGHADTATTDANTRSATAGNHMNSGVSSCRPAVSVSIGMCGDPRLVASCAKRAVSRVRVRVEHAIAGVKRSRIVKDVRRNTKAGTSDSAMEAASGLHNLRVRTAATRARIKQILIPDKVYSLPYTLRP